MGAKAAWRKPAPATWSADENAHALDVARLHTPGPHAAAILALCALDAGRGVRVAASLIAAGALLFSGELATHALTGAQPLPLAAPTGGLLMIAGRLVVAVAAPLALRQG